MKKRNLMLKVVAAVLLFILVLAGPNGFFYLKWMSPTQALLPIEPRPENSFVAPGLSERRAMANYELLLDTTREASMPSMSAAIAYDGTLQWNGAAGYSDLASKQFATPASRYRLGSVSKALTATLLAVLIDKQEIDLDEEAGTYYPALPAHYANVTPRMLASHTAGVSHYSNVPTYWLGWHPAISGKSYASVEEGLAIFIDEDLLFAPGTGFQYSTYGYSLLARLMEGAASSSFEALLRNELFMPAGLNNTAVDHAQIMENRVSFYNTGDGKYTDAYPSNSSYKIAGGGIVSTPSDLALLGQALLDGTLLSEDSRPLMWTPTKLPDGSVNPQRYGLGWRINESTAILSNEISTIIIHHGGNQNGGSAFLMIVPEYGISVAAMSNSGSDEARGAVEDICFELVRRAVAEMTSSDPAQMRKE